MGCVPSCIPILAFSRRVLKLMSDDFVSRQKSGGNSYSGKGGGTHRSPSPHYP